MVTKEKLHTCGVEFFLLLGQDPDTHLFNVSNKSVKCFRSIFCKCCKDLSVNSDLLISKGLDEAAVLDPVCLKCCIDARDPQTSEVILLVFSMRESMELCMVDGIFSLALFCSAAESVAFYLFEDVAASFV